mgnify:CR=1 FL=1
MTGKRRNDRKKKKIRENPCKSMRKIINEKNLWESMKSDEENSDEEKR